MQTTQAIALGIIQGLSEFLPISSSAHLILVPYFFKWHDPGLAFDVALHMGTLAAILLFFWRDWAAIARQIIWRRKSGDPTWTATVDWRHLVAGCIPAAAAGYLFEHQAEEAFRSPPLIAATLSVFGLLLWYFDARGKKSGEIETIGLREALLIGCAQALAIVPGVSRSGVTITAALALGFTRPAAMRFSFLLAAPIIAGAGLVKAKSIFILLTQGGPESAAVLNGFAASLISGLGAAWLLSYIVKSRTLTPFVIYRFALSVVIVIVFR
ncbi:MAG: undecaprenyl-diphosphate phosphatase [Deltaproteobacteria bacterium]|nr:undecaprenyl-diphosphate phosphatase [Deltaproteobacteria bacterium]